MTRSKNPLATESYTIQRGDYTTLLYNKRALRIVLKGRGRRYIAEQKVDYKRFNRHVSDESILWDMLEEHWANSSLETVRPEEVGALTDCTLVTFEAERTDQGDLIECGTVYGFQGYMLQSELESMLETGEAVLTSEW